VIGIALGDIAVLGNLIILAAFISVVPFFIYKYSHFMWLKSLETQFPNFIRDLSDAHRSGMSFPQAIGMASRSNYGKLTPEIQSMNNRLSWGTPVNRVLEIFAKKTKDSKIITEALNIITESYNSGGKISSTLSSVADDILMIKEAEAERTSLVRQHVMLMYGIFYMFMAVSVIIIFVLVPMMKSAPQSTSMAGGLGMQFSNPCQNQGSGFPCILFDSTCAMFDQPVGISCYYFSIFFFVTLIQGVLMGLIAGQLGENSVVAGSKHSLIMVFSAIGVFLFLAKAGLLPT
jgi:flagellar protein FlaJ